MTNNHTGKQIGYIRASSIDQNPERQLNGHQCDRVFTDHASGTSMNRPQLKELLFYIREDDTLIVHSMDRLARNVDDLRKLVKELTERQVKVVFIKENMTFTKDADPMSQLMLSVMGAFAEFEREIIRERQKEGIAIAQAKGKFKGRKNCLMPAQIQELRCLAATGKNKAELARSYGISRGSVYKYLKQSQVV